MPKMTIATMVTAGPSAARDDSTRDPQAWMPTGSDVQLTAHTRRALARELLTRSGLPTPSCQGSLSPVNYEPGTQPLLAGGRR
jgi:hypothetical protein